MSAPEIFDPELRRLRRDRAAPGFAEHAFLIDHIAEGILDRLDGVRREFGKALDLGCHDGRLGNALKARGMEVVSVDTGRRFAENCGGIQCDEDQLPFADASFDLVVSAGVLDQVNDLPGALTLIRRALRPDGLFLAGFVGAGSLPLLRNAVMTADMAAGGAVASRMHPMIDVRAAGDLLARAGFTLTVADGEPLTVRYSSPFRLFADLRGMAMTNMLKVRQAPPYSRGRLQALLAALAEQTAADGKLPETFELIFMTGWAPGPEQPKPARRGSGTHSLAKVFKPFTQKDSG
jgi:SAM-dependent methyltransferase